MGPYRRIARDLFRMTTCVARTREHTAAQAAAYSWRRGKGKEEGGRGKRGIRVQKTYLRVADSRELEIPQRELYICSRYAGMLLTYSAALMHPKNASKDDRERERETARSLGDSRNDRDLRSAQIFLARRRAIRGATREYAGALCENVISLRGIFTFRNKKYVCGKSADMPSKTGLRIEDGRGWKARERLEIVILVSPSPNDQHDSAQNYNTLM